MGFLCTHYDKRLRSLVHVRILTRIADSLTPGEKIVLWGKRKSLAVCTECAHCSASSIGCTYGHAEFGVSIVAPYTTSGPSLFANAVRVIFLCNVDRLEPQREKTFLLTCAQRRYKSVCTSAQPDQSLRCLHEETLHPWLSKMRLVKILIRLRKCAVWSESSLGALVLRDVFWCCA